MPNYTIGNTKGQRLGNATYVKYGYGQVEPNHLSAQRTGQIYAQLPAKSDIELLVAITQKSAAYWLVVGAHMMAN